MSWSFSIIDGANTVTLSAKPGDKIYCPTMSDLGVLQTTFGNSHGTANFISGGGEKGGYCVTYQMPFGRYQDPNSLLCMGSVCPCLWPTSDLRNSILYCSYSQEVDSTTAFSIRTNHTQIFKPLGDTCCYMRENVENCPFELIDPPPQ